jgi:hypothetical protein
MNFIIYSIDNTNNSYGIKSINESIYNKLLQNNLHKQLNFSILAKKIEKEFNLILDI